MPTSLLSDLSDIAGCEAQAYMAALDDVLTRIAAVEIPIKEQNSPREITDKTASEDDITVSSPNLISSCEVFMHCREVGYDNKN